MSSIDTAASVTELQADTSLAATFLQLSVGHVYRPQILAGAIEISEPTSSDERPDGRGLRFSLGQNKPNPFNSVTVISYTLDKAGRARLDIYNIVGQIVATLIDRHHTPGQYQCIWKGANSAGREMPSGVYFYRLSTPEERAVRKLVLMK